MSDVLLNQVEGLPQSDSALSKLLPFAIEATWVTGKWGKLEKYLNLSSNSLESDFSTGIGSALLALHKNDMEKFKIILHELRQSSARNLSTTTTASLQACHDVILRFHILTEVEAISGVHASGRCDRRSLMESMERRIEVLGAFLSDKQYLLGIRRAAMQLSP